MYANGYAIKRQMTEEQSAKRKERKNTPEKSSVPQMPLKSNALSLFVNARNAVIRSGTAENTKSQSAYGMTKYVIFTVGF